jgi:toxin ParE1/3/4
MKRFVVSAGARKDIDEIAAYTTRTWSSQQTDRYLSRLEDGFHLLAQSPSMGRPCKEIDPELRRFEVEKHVVFFRLKRDGIRIVRVLHQQVLPLRAHFES